MNEQRSLWAVTLNLDPVGHCVHVVALTAEEAVEKRRAQVRGLLETDDVPDYVYGLKNKSSEEVERRLRVDEIRRVERIEIE